MQGTAFINIQRPVLQTPETLEVFVDRWCGMSLAGALAMGVGDVASVELVDNKALVTVNTPPTTRLAREIFVAAAREGMFPARSLTDAHVMKPVPAEGPDTLGTILVSQPAMHVFSSASQPLAAKCQPGTSNVTESIHVYSGDGRYTLMRNFSLSEREQSVLVGLSEPNGEVVPYLSYLQMAEVSADTVARLKEGLLKGNNKGGNMPPVKQPERRIHLPRADILGRNNVENLFSWDQWQALLKQFTANGTNMPNEELLSFLEDMRAHMNAEEEKGARQSADSDLAEYLGKHPEVVLRLKDRTDTVARESFDRMYARAHESYRRSVPTIARYAGAFSLHELVGASSDEHAIRLPLLLPAGELNKMYKNWQKHPKFQLVAFDETVNMYACALPIETGTLLVTAMPSSGYKDFVWTRMDMFTKEAYGELISNARTSGSISVS